MLPEPSSGEPEAHPTMSTLQASIYAWLKKMRDGKMSQEWKKNSEEYLRLKCEAEGVKQKLLEHSKKCFELRLMRDQLTRKSKEAKRVIASLGLLKRMFTRQGKVRHSEFQKVQQEVRDSLENNQSTFESTLKAVRTLTEEVAAVRLERDRVLVSLFLQVENEMKLPRRPLFDLFVDEMPQALHEHLQHFVHRQCAQWHQELAIGRRQAGKIERNLSLDEQKIRGQVIRSRVDEIASETVAAFGSVEDKRAREMFIDRMKQLIQQEYEGVMRSENLGEALNLLFETAYFHAQDRVHASLAAKLREQNLDEAFFEIMK